MIKKNIVFVGGGSGGHIQPIASLFDYAKQYTNIPKQSKRYRFGQQGGLEETYAGRYDEVIFVPVSTGKLRRYITIQSVMQNCRDIFLILYGFLESIWYLKKYSIDMIFCKGGFVCPQVAYAGRLLGIPVCMHESDMHMGLANRLTLPVAKAVFTGFGGVVDHEVVVGQILSPKLLDNDQVVFEGIDNAETITLVMGGSQGAAILFDTVHELVCQGVTGSVQFIFLLGTKNQEGKDYSIAGKIWTLGFVTQGLMASLYALCDVAITRGSASALQEQQLFGLKKAILPLPYTGGDHQTVNAKRYEDMYGDTYIPQDTHMKERLKHYILCNVGYKKQSITPTVDELNASSLAIRSFLLQ